MKKFRFTTSISYMIMLCLFTVSSVKAQETLIPDSNFEQQLINQGHDSGPIDGKVLTANIDALTFLSITGSAVTDLTGIEDFTSLTFINVTGTSITSLDLTGLTQLTRIQAEQNDLTSINVTGLSQLNYLSVFSNNLATIDLTGLTALETLLIYFNPLTSLNTTPATELVEIRASDTGLSSFDLSTNTKLERIESSNNNLTTIDFSNNPLMKSMFIRSNQLTALVGVENLIDLEFLGINDNNIVSLDLSNNSNLNTIQLHDNSLELLNLKNGNNVNTSINVSNNPNLTCITVDDVAFSTSNWSVDSQTTFSLDCDLEGYTVIPDSNFEQLLINQNLDSGGIDGKVLTANIDKITSLSIVGSTITDLTGINDFVSLTFLNIGGTSLTTLDVTNLSELERIQAGGNSNLSNLNILGLLKLNTLFINNCNFTQIDTSNNPELTDLWASNNPNLNSFDLSNNTKLEHFESSNNSLTSIDFTNNTKLERVYIVSNDITSLDFSNHPNLVSVQFGENTNLASLKIKNNTTTNLFIGNSNCPNLTCISVDDVAFSTSNWTLFSSSQASFNLNCDPIKIYAKKDGVSNAPRIHVWPNEVESNTSNWPNNLQFMTASVTYPDYFEYEIKNGQTTVNTLFLFDGVQTPDQNTITEDTWFTVASNGSVSRTTTAPVAATTPVLTVSTGGTFDVGTVQTITASATLGAEIRFTSSAVGVPSNPTSNSPLYTGPISVSGTGTLTYKFIAFNGSDFSTIETRVFTFVPPATSIKIYAKKDGVTNAPRIHIWPNEVESDTSNWPNNLQFMTASVTYPDYFEYEVKNGQTTVNTLFLFDGVQTPDQNTITEDTWFTVASNGSISRTTTAPVAATTPVLTVSTGGTFDIGTTQLVTASATLNAEIRFTSSVSGIPANPTTSSPLYTGPISLSESAVYKFRAFNGSDASTVETVTYTFNPVNAGIKIYAKKEGVSTAPRIHIWPNETNPANWPNNLPFMISSSNGYYEYEVQGGQTLVNTLFIFDGVQTTDLTDITQDTWFTVASNGSVTSTTTPPSALRSSVVDNQVKGLVVAPSPANNYIQVSYPYFGTDTGIIEIYNLTGQKVVSKTFNSQSELEERIDVSGLANGIHILSIQVGAIQEIVRLSIVK